MEMAIAFGIFLGSGCLKVFRRFAFQNREDIGEDTTKGEDVARRVAVFSSHTLRRGILGSVSPALYSTQRTLMLPLQSCCLMVQLYPSEYQCKS